MKKRFLLVLFSLGIGVTIAYAVDVEKNEEVVEKVGVKVMPKLTLYIGGGCPYCKRVTDFLSKNNLNDKVTIKDVWSNDQASSDLKTMAGKGQVPCLQMDDEHMHESNDIIKKLEELLVK